MFLYMSLYTQKTTEAVINNYFNQLEHLYAYFSDGIPL